MNELVNDSLVNEFVNELRLDVNELVNELVQ